MKTSCYLFILVGLIGSACATGKGPVTTAPAPPAKTAVHLDLAKYRPTFATTAESAVAAKPNVVPTHHINSLLHPTLDSLAEKNRNIVYAQGYRILVYSGNERKQAMDVRKALAQLLPNEKEYFTYQHPTFRIKVGDYLSRIEARMVMNQLQGLAPNAMLIPEQININTSPAR